MSTSTCYFVASESIDSEICFQFSFFFLSSFHLVGGAIHHGNYPWINLIWGSAGQQCKMQCMMDSVAWPRVYYVWFGLKAMYFWLYLASVTLVFRLNISTSGAYNWVHQEKHFAEFYQARCTEFLISTYLSNGWDWS